MMRSASFGNPAARLLFAAAAVCFSAFPSTASADLLWNWSFATEAGTFSTNGTPLNATGAFNFTITNFTVTASANNQAIGQTYNSFYPPQGFLWNGGQVTQFYHNNDLDTVLSYFSVYIDLFPSDYREFEYYFSDYFSAGTGDFYVREGGSLQYSADGPLTLTLSSSAVPEINPAGIGSVLTLVAGALGLVERRRLASV